MYATALVFVDSALPDQWGSRVTAGKQDGKFVVFDFSTDPRVVLRLLTQRPEHPVSVHYLIPETVAILFALIEKYRPELLDDLLAVAEQKTRLRRSIAIFQFCLRWPGVEMDVALWHCLDQWRPR